MGIQLAERHSYEAAQPEMGRERRYISIGLFGLNLPVATVGGQGGKHFRLPKGFNTLVHPRYRVQVIFSDGPQFPVIDTNA